MSTTPEHERPSTRWKHSRTYPNGRRVADLSSIPPTPDSTCGRLCTPERIVPGLRRLARTTPGQQRLLEAEALAHFALSAGATEARLVTPVALALSEGHALLLPQGLRKDLRERVGQCRHCGKCAWLAAGPAKAGFDPIPPVGFSATKRPVPKDS